MKPVIFSIRDYEYLGTKIAAEASADLGKVEQKHFADGERYLRIASDVRGRDAVLVGGTHTDSATLDVFDLACGLVAEGCQSLTLVVPFFGYSTMERAVRTGEVVTAKTRARILSAIPNAPFGNRVMLLDLHSEGIPFYFEGEVKTCHLYAKSLVIEEARKLGGADFVLGCVDAGRAKWVESLANDMHVQAGFVYKKRNPDGKTFVSGVNVSVDGKDVVIYDDMIRSGGSVLGAVQAYKAAGAKKISVIATHGLFSSGGLSKLKSSGMISNVVCTDSHPEAVKQNSELLRVVSTAKLFAQALSDWRQK